MRYELSNGCPACTASDSTTVASADDMRRELEMLWEFHGARIRPGAPAERLADRLAFSQRPPLQLVQCTGCGLVYRNPRERAEALRDAYAQESPRRDVLQTLFTNQLPLAERQERRLAQLVGRRGEGLEVGSYVGAFLVAAHHAGWRFEGVDVNECVNAFARAHGARVTTGDLDAIDPARRWDAVAFWNCFDQLPDPVAAARLAHEVLRERGVLAVRVPDGELYARLRRALHGPAAPLARAVLAVNNLLGFPYRHGFSRRSLTALLERCGFTVVRVVRDTLVPTADELTRRWAALEEQAIKVALRAVARGPWLEVYAVRR